MTTAEARKKMRGTRRVCRSCAVPFYDLARDPIVCPACGAHYALEAEPAQAEVRGPAFARRPGWSRGFERQGPAAPTVTSASTDPESAAPIKEDGEDAEAAAEVVHDEDIGLEQEHDDSDVSELLDRENVEDDGER
jgi:uncharacterized protein (TIGR02300 family)